jgi:hypothetical protein
MTYRIEDKVTIQPGTAANEAASKGQLDAATADAKNRATHTGTQTVATLSDFNAEVDARIQAVVGAAPAALDTLAELAAALGDDADFAAGVTTQLGNHESRIDALEGAPSGARSMTALIGDGSASSFNIDHNWALADKNKVRVEVIDTSTDGETVTAKVTRPTVNRVTVSFGSHQPTANQYMVLLSEVTG